MQESQFREWLEANGAQTKAGRDTRVHAVGTIEKKLGELGFAYRDLEEAWAANQFEDIREAISNFIADFDAGGDKFKVLMPASEAPRQRLAGWRAWLGQYGRFLSAEGTGTKDADRIRQYVLEHFIEPARARDEESVELVVREVNDALGLAEAWLNICQALRGSRFQQVADVPPPESFGPDMSSATRFRIGLDASRNWALSTLRARYGNPIKQTKKIAAFALSDGRQIALDLEPGAVRVWVEGDVEPGEGRGSIEAYVAHSPRHSNLPSRLNHQGAESRPVSRVVVFNAQGLLTMLDQYDAASRSFDAAALQQLKDRFLSAFPDFEKEGGFPVSKKFAEEEDSYKRDLIEAAHALVSELSNDPEKLGAELIKLMGGKRGLPSNLIHWMMFDGLTKRMARFPGEFEKAVAEIALADDPSDAIVGFNDKLWAKAFADPKSNPFGDSRTLPTTIAALTHPNDAIALRTDRFNRLSKALLGKSHFTYSPLSKDELETALGLARDLFVIMRDDWRWNPRDLWDVQGFIWVACGNQAPVPNSLDDTPVWFVTARYGEEDGLDRFIDRSEWSLISDTGSFNNQRVRDMRVGDVIVARDFFHQTHNLPFDANGKRVTVFRIRAIGRIREESDDGLRVGVDWDPVEPPRSWFFYTFTDPVWRLKSPGENAYADCLRRFILDGEEQDIAWFLSEPFWKERLFGKDDADVTDAIPPTNLILYGPPGTGKTYRTAIEAVRLCDGSAPYDESDAGRRALMTRYRELIDARRIEFVTFHQNFSYEDFVEGLRPETRDDGAGAGFRLKPIDGIFKRISDKAAKAVVKSGGLSLEGRKFFKLSLGQANDHRDDWVYDEAIEEGYALLGFANVDLSDPKFANRDAIFETMKNEFPDRSITPQMGVVKSPDRFRNQIEVGDIVIVSKGLNAFRAVGLVEGGYEYAPHANGQYCHRRKVRWLWDEPDGMAVGELSPDKRFSLDTIYELPKGRLNLALLDQLINAAGDEEAGEVLPHVLIIDEINRANVSKVLGELITLLEPDKRLGMANALTVRLPYSRAEFGVPANLHIVGTMNSADRSIALLDTALRRRFQFREMAPDYSVAAFQDAEQTTGLPLTSFLQAINRRIEYLVDRDHRIGHAFFLGCESKDAVDRVMRDKVIPLLQEYFFEDWDRLAAVLGERGTARNFLECEEIEDPMGEGGAPIRSWRVRDRFNEDAYSRCAGLQGSGGAEDSETVA